MGRRDDIINNAKDALGLQPKPEAEKPRVTVQWDAQAHLINTDKFKDQPEAFQWVAPAPKWTGDIDAIQKKIDNLWWKVPEISPAWEGKPVPEVEKKPKETLNIPAPADQVTKMPDFDKLMKEGEALKTKPKGEFEQWMSDTEKQIAAEPTPPVTAFVDQVRVGIQIKQVQRWAENEERSEMFNNLQSLSDKLYLYPAGPEQLKDTSSRGNGQKYDNAGNPIYDDATLKDINRNLTVKRWGDITAYVYQTIEWYGTIYSTFIAPQLDNALKQPWADPIKIKNYFYNIQLPKNLNDYATKNWILRSGQMLTPDEAKQFVDGVMKFDTFKKENDLKVENKIAKIQQWLSVTEKAKIAQPDFDYLSGWITRTLTATGFDIAFYPQLMTTVSAIDSINKQNTKNILNIQSQLTDLVAELDTRSKWLDPSLSGLNADIKKLNAESLVVMDINTAYSNALVYHSNPSFRETEDVATAKSQQEAKKVVDDKYGTGTYNYVTTKFSHNLLRGSESINWRLIDQYSDLKWKTTTALYNLKSMRRGLDSSRALIQNVSNIISDSVLDPQKRFVGGLSHTYMSDADREFGEYTKIFNSSAADYMQAGKVIGVMADIWMVQKWFSALDDIAGLKNLNTALTAIEEVGSFSTNVGKARAIAATRFTSRFLMDMWPANAIAAAEFMKYSPYNYTMQDHQINMALGGIIHTLLAGFDYRGLKLLHPELNSENLYKLAMTKGQILETRSIFTAIWEDSKFIPEGEAWKTQVTVSNNVKANMYAEAIDPKTFSDITKLDPTAYKLRDWFIITQTADGGFLLVVPDTKWQIQFIPMATTPKEWKAYKPMFPELPAPLTPTKAEEWAVQVYLDAQKEVFDKFKYDSLSQPEKDRIDALIKNSLMLNKVRLIGDELSAALGATPTAEVYNTITKSIIPQAQLAMIVDPTVKPGDFLDIINNTPKNITTFGEWASTQKVMDTMFSPAKPQEILPVTTEAKTEQEVLAGATAQIKNPQEAKNKQAVIQKLWGITKTPERNYKVNTIGNMFLTEGDTSKLLVNAAESDINQIQRVVSLGKENAYVAKVVEDKVIITKATPAQIKDQIPLLYPIIDGSNIKFVKSALDDSTAVGMEYLERGKEEAWMHGKFDPNMTLRQIGSDSYITDALATTVPDTIRIEQYVKKIYSPLEGTEAVDGFVNQLLKYQEENKLFPDITATELKKLQSNGTYNFVNDYIVSLIPGKIEPLQDNLVTNAVVIGLLSSKWGNAKLQLLNNISQNLTKIGEDIKNAKPYQTIPVTYEEDWKITVKQLDVSANIRSLKEKQNYYNDMLNNLVVGLVADSPLHKKMFMDAIAKTPELLRWTNIDTMMRLSNDIFDSDAVDFLTKTMPRDEVMAYFRENKNAVLEQIKATIKRQALTDFYAVQKYGYNKFLQTEALPKYTIEWGLVDTPILFTMNENYVKDVYKKLASLFTPEEMKLLFDKKNKDAAVKMFMANVVKAHDTVMQKYFGQGFSITQNQYLENFFTSIDPEAIYIEVLQQAKIMDDEKKIESLLTKNFKSIMEGESTPGLLGINLNNFLIRTLSDSIRGYSTDFVTSILPTFKWAFWAVPDYKPIAGMTMNAEQMMKERFNVWNNTLPETNNIDAAYEDMTSLFYWLAQNSLKNGKVDPKLINLYKSQMNKLIKLQSPESINLIQTKMAEVVDNFTEKNRIVDTATYATKLENDYALQKINQLDDFLSETDPASKAQILKNYQDEVATIKSNPWILKEKESLYIALDAKYYDPAQYKQEIGYRAITDVGNSNFPVSSKDTIYYLDTARWVSAEAKVKSALWNSNILQLPGVTAQRIDFSNAAITQAAANYGYDIIVGFDANEVAARYINELLESHPWYVLGNNEFVPKANRLTPIHKELSFTIDDGWNVLVTSKYRQPIEELKKQLSQWYRADNFKIGLGMTKDGVEKWIREYLSLYTDSTVLIDEALKNPEKFIQILDLTALSFTKDDVLHIADPELFKPLVETKLNINGDMFSIDDTFLTQLNTFGFKIGAKDINMKNYDDVIDLLVRSFVSNPADTIGKKAAKLELFNRYLLDQNDAETLKLLNDAETELTRQYKSLNEIPTKLMSNEELVNFRTNAAVIKLYEHDYIRPISYGQDTFGIIDMIIRNREKVDDGLDALLSPLNAVGKDRASVASGLPKDVDNYLEKLFDKNQDYFIKMFDANNVTRKMEWTAKYPGDLYGETEFGAGGGASYATNKLANMKDIDRQTKIGAALYVLTTVIDSVDNDVNFFKKYAMSAELKPGLLSIDKWIHNTLLGIDLGKPPVIGNSFSDITSNVLPAGKIDNSVADKKIAELTTQFNTYLDDTEKVWIKTLLDWNSTATDKLALDWVILNLKWVVHDHIKMVNDTFGYSTLFGDWKTEVDQAIIKYSKQSTLNMSVNIPEVITEVKAINEKYLTDIYKAAKEKTSLDLEWILSRGEDQVRWPVLDNTTNQIIWWSKKVTLGDIIEDIGKETEKFWVEPVKRMDDQPIEFQRQLLWRAIAQGTQVLQDTILSSVQWATNLFPKTVIADIKKNIVAKRATFGDGLVSYMKWFDDVDLNGKLEDLFKDVVNDVSEAKNAMSTYLWFGLKFLKTYKPELKPEQIREFFRWSVVKWLAHVIGEDAVVDGKFIQFITDFVDKAEEKILESYATMFNESVRQTTLGKSAYTTLEKDFGARRAKVRIADIAKLKQENNIKNSLNYIINVTAKNEKESASRIARADAMNEYGEVQLQLLQKDINYKLDTLLTQNRAVVKESKPYAEAIKLKKWNYFGGFPSMEARETAIEINERMRLYNLYLSKLPTFDVYKWLLSVWAKKYPTDFKFMPLKNQYGQEVLNDSDRFININANSIDRFGNQIPLTEAWLLPVADSDNTMDEIIAGLMETQHQTDRLEMQAQAGDREAEKQLQIREWAEDRMTTSEWLAKLHPEYNFEGFVTAKQDFKPIIDNILGFEAKKNLDIGGLKPIEPFIPDAPQANKIQWISPKVEELIGIASEKENKELIEEINKIYAQEQLTKWAKEVMEKNKPCFSPYW